MHRTKTLVAPIALAVVLVLGSGAAASAASATPGHGGGHAGNRLARFAAVEGVTATVLAQDLKQGETLLQIAGSKYANAQDLAVALLAPQKTRLDAAVTAQRITASQETTRYTALLSTWTKLVVTPHPFQAAGLRDAAGKSFGQGHARGMLLHRLVPEIASTCLTTTSALTTLVQAGGTSVLAACQTTNPAATQGQLTAVLLAPIQAKLTTEETAGKITQAQVQARTAKYELAIGKALTRTLPAHTGA